MLPPIIFKKFRILFVCGVVFLWNTTSFSVYAQADNTPVVSLSISRGSTSELIKALEQESGWVISYSNRLCFSNDKQIPLGSNSLLGHLNVIFADCPFHYEIRNKRLILRPLERHEITYVVRGFVREGQSGESLPAANIFDLSGGQGTVSNNFGYYHITLSEGFHRLRATYVGHKSSLVEFELKRDTVIDFSLISSVELSEVSIVGHRFYDYVNAKRMGATVIPLEEIRNTPALLGEADLVKNIQMLPGIQGGSEGFSGLYVRGGGPDQNLILLDDVPVYNIGHLLGFFSVFNADAVKHVSVYKGGFPARYGGRLSSVVDIRMVEGNNDRVRGRVNLGLLSSGVSVDGPVKKDKSAFALSFRRTYMDAIAGIAQRGEDEKVNYYFYDINGRFNHSFNERSRLYLSVYLGRDKYYTSYNYQEVGTESPSSTTASVNDENNAGWGNFVSALRWNYLITPRLFSNITATFSDYRFFIGVKRNSQNNNIWDTYEQRYLSGIKDYSLKADFDFYAANNHLVKFGVDGIVHDFNPGIDIIRRNLDTSQPVDTTIGNIYLTGSELHFYIEDEFRVSSKWRFNAGLRLNVFKGESKFYHSIEPRFTGYYAASPRFGFRGGYSVMSQYIHLVSSSNVALPTDLWLPVTDQLPPMYSRQISVGSDWQMDERKSYTLTVDLYYKELDNLLHYKESTGFFDYSTQWEDKLTNGSGRSYGAEIVAGRRRGDLQGSIGYTYANTENTFDGLNGGLPFPARFDRRHDVSINMNYKFNPRVDGSLMWQYGSGTPVTLPSEKYYAPEFPFGNGSGAGFSENAARLNDFRMPAFHRLDVGFNFHKQKEKTHREWSLGVLNLYGRQNPFLLYYVSESDNEPGSAGRQLKQLSLFPFPIPYVRYTLRF
jgi:hypothetical protein